MELVIAVPRSKGGRKRIEVTPGGGIRLPCFLAILCLSRNAVLSNYRQDEGSKASVAKRCVAGEMLALSFMLARLRCYWTWIVWEEVFTKLANEGKKKLLFKRELWFYLNRKKKIPRASRKAD